LDQRATGEEDTEIEETEEGTEEEGEEEEAELADTGTKEGEIMEDAEDKEDIEDCSAEARVVATSVLFALDRVRLAKGGGVM
jgi:hypothetical protein